MFYIKSVTKLKFLCILLSLEVIQCSIDGTFTEYRRNRTKPSDDPCNPLYWYPQNIPEYCNFKKMPTPPTDPGTDPIPLPVPAPLPILPPSEVPPIMMPPHAMPPGPLPPIPFPIMPLPMPLPFGIPLAPTNPMVPVAGIPLPPPPAFPMHLPPQYPLPYPSPYGVPYAPPLAAPYPPPIGAPYPPQFPQPYPGPFPAPYPPPYPMPSPGMGMVPGVPGIVSPDGGINIMPFSDAYSDMLDAHKQKMIRRRMHKLLQEYERPPWKSRRNTRRHSGNEVIDVIHEEKFNENAFID